MFVIQLLASLLRAARGRWAKALLIFVYLAVSLLFPGFLNGSFPDGPPDSPPSTSSPTPPPDTSTPTPPVSTPSDPPTTPTTPPTTPPVTTPPVTTPPETTPPTTAPPTTPPPTTPPPTTPPTPSGPQTIVSLTFDDSNADQWPAVQTLDALGLHGTFYVVSGWINADGYLSLDQLRSMAAMGNEIGGHTVSHPDLTTVPAAEARRQICNDRATISSWGFAVTDFAYPYASTDDSVEKIAADCGYNSARMLGDIASRFGCSDCDHAESMPPGDPYYTKALDEVDDTWTLHDLKKGVTDAESHGGGWVQFTFHHVCDHCADLSISPSLFQQFTEWLAARSATHNTVVRTVAQVVGGPVQPVVTASLPPAPGPGVNGIQNPGLETLGANGVPACWQTGGYGTNTSSFATVSPGHAGAVAEQLTMTGFQSGDAKLLPTLDQGECAPTVTPGHRYSLRGWYVSDAPTQFEVYLRNAQGDWSYWTASPWLAASTTWASGEWTTPAIPDGYTALSFGLNIFQNGVITTDDYAMYDSVGAPAAPVAPPTPPAPKAMLMTTAPATTPPATPEPADPPATSDPSAAPSGSPSAASGDPTTPPASDPPATEPPASDPAATDPPSTDPPSADPAATDPPATPPPAAPESPAATLELNVAVGG